MSGEVRARTTEQTSTRWTVPLVMVGLALLLGRLALIGTAGAPGSLSAAYLLLGVLFLVAPVPPATERSLQGGVVLAIGVAAICVASLLAGQRAPLPHGRGAIALGCLAAVSEEIFFRRFLYGRLAAHGPVIAVVVSALLFALVHVPAYGLSVFWVDMGAGLLFAWQRWASGSWATPAATHVFANVLSVLR